MCRRVQATETSAHIIPSQVIAAAGGGDDPFTLDESTVKIVFGVTAEGDITIGVNGSLANELTQTLVLTLASA
jgi:hypothetical protein